MSGVGESNPEQTLILREDEHPREVPGEVWKILIVDDDDEVHHVTRLVLADLCHGGRGVCLMSAYSGQEARHLLHAHRDVSVILLDVVMESEEAGLHLIRHIREELNNSSVRIILRTGQPGQAPERRIIIEYDINDYREKTELSAQKLFTSVAASVRAFETIQQLQAINSNLEEMVAARTQDLRLACQDLRRTAEELQAHRDRLQYEQELAKALLANVHEAERLDFPNLRYRLWPVDVANGDLILAARAPDGRQLIMIGDFTGHGLPAAIGALPVADLFHREVGRGCNIRSLISSINDELHRKLPRGLFLAACVIEVGTDQIVHAWNGGVPAAFVYSADAGVRERITSSDLPLGVVPSGELAFDIQHLSTRRGDRLFIYSDGLVEARNPEGEMFGEKRLEHCLREHGASETFFERVREQVEAFLAGNPQADDITMAELVLHAT